jgi:hypothetical protein
MKLFYVSRKLQCEAMKSCDVFLHIPDYLSSCDTSYILFSEMLKISLRNCDENIEFSDIFHYQNEIFKIN